MYREREFVEMRSLLSLVYLVFTENVKNKICIRMYIYIHIISILNFKSRKMAVRPQKQIFSVYGHRNNYYSGTDSIGHPFFIHYMLRYLIEFQLIGFRFFINCMESF